MAGRQSRPLFAAEQEQATERRHDAVARGGVNPVTFMRIFERAVLQNAATPYLGDAIATAPAR